MIRTCKKCLIDKNLDLFPKNSPSLYGHTHICKECTHTRIKKFRQENIEYVKEQKKEINKKYNDIHRYKKRVHQKEYYSNIKNTTEYKKKHSKWNNTYNKKRKDTDPNYKLKLNLRARLNQAIRYGYKAGSAVRDLGCSIEELRIQLESKFQPGMTWENWSRTGWHIDHIKPLASFDLTNREQFLEACHYSNLQPLWAKDNIKKAAEV